MPRINPDRLPIQPLEYCDTQEQFISCFNDNRDNLILGQDGMHPIHIAARKGFMEAVKMLKDNGADINARDAYGRTPLHLMIRRCRISNDAESKKYYDLSIADIVQQGADINAEDNNRSTPLSYAIEQDKPAIIHLLKYLGANLNNEAIELLTKLEQNHERLTTEGKQLSKDVKISKRKMIAFGIIGAVLSISPLITLDFSKNRNFMKNIFRQIFKSSSDAIVENIFRSFTVASFISGAALLGGAVHCHIKKDNFTEKLEKNIEEIDGINKKSDYYVPEIPNII